MVIKYKLSLSFKLLVSFSLIIVVLVSILFYGNMYAMNTVRLEVSKSTERLLHPHIAQVDESLSQINLFLLRMKTMESTYQDLVGLSLYAPGGSDYFFAKQRIFNYFEDSAEVYPGVYAFFVYSSLNKDTILFAPSLDDTITLRTFIERQAVSFTSAHQPLRSYEQKWELLQYGDKYYLMRKQLAGSEVTIGALVEIDTLITQLKSFEEAKSWQWIVMSDEERPLTESLFGEDELRRLRDSLKGTNDETFVTASIGGDDYLLVNTSFNEAPARLTTVIPEKEMLAPLLVFQRALYLIPFIGALIVVIYIWFIRSVFVRPMKGLIRGMSQIGYGDLTVRLEEEKTKELAFVSDTFNKMVMQIKDLKIDVYEEKLKKQRAEFKHLQAQIKPHFYLNSLNIINSLSILGENHLVEKMTEHLAEYFRFITHSHRESITLKDEINHIENYLEIQKLRFPDKLTYAIDLPPKFEAAHILPLIVQPFAENAIIHGMHKGKQPFHIRIAVRRWEQSDEYMEIIVSDNGKGFPPERLEKLKEQGFMKGEGAQHVGIWNVHHRLRMKYGNLARITFMNGEDGGAEVRLFIPHAHDQEGSGGEA